MNWKSYFLGVATTILLLLMAGAGYSAIMTSGQSLTVPEGKDAYVVYISTSYRPMVQDAAKFYARNDDLTMVQAYTLMNEKWTGCVKNSVVSGKKHYDDLHSNNTFPVE